MASMMDEDPKLWGAPFWICMRKIAERYPVSDPAPEVRTAAKAYYESLMFLLPCGTCREHYAELLSKYPVNVTCRQNLMEWVEIIRKEVDKNVGAAARRAPPPQHSAEAFRRLVPSKTIPNQRVLPPSRANVFRQPTVVVAPPSASELRIQRNLQIQLQQQAQQQPKSIAPRATRRGVPSASANIPKSGCSSCAARRTRTN